ncbi:hypothetical protein [Mycolicibacterium austroafricanum]|uniref:hypothetical protein n=1 Tax=Mycolicibacterium austroafricanum TaxID=39687 RepID=UPI001CA312E3|nr:hypothetical protein [Mycolicibacterium austroafricanum]QZT61246.1 hypothetical protein JN085_19965 [Mycolicibacterium austroafricanum]
MKVKWNMRGFRELRSAPGVVGELESITEGWADDANAMLEGDLTNDGFVAYSREGKKVRQGRWQTGVVTKGRYAKRANAKDDILLKVMKK